MRRLYRWQRGEPRRKTWHIWETTSNVSTRRGRSAGSGQRTIAPFNGSTNPRKERSPRRIEVFYVKLSMFGIETLLTREPLSSTPRHSVCRHEVRAASSYLRVEGHLNALNVERDRRVSSSLAHRADTLPRYRPRI